MSRLLGNPVASAVIGTDEPLGLAKGQVPLGSASVAGTTSCRRPSQPGAAASPGRNRTDKAALRTRRGGFRIV